MRSLLIVIFFINFLVSHGSEGSQAPKQLTIIHINDFHAHFEEMSRTTAVCKDKETCIGGYEMIEIRLSKV